MDDTAITNNDDIIKVMATIIEIIVDFTDEYPDTKIVFTGSNQVRTSLYFRILKMYHTSFSKTFIITGLVKAGNQFIEVPFEPESNDKYLAFLVKRK